MTFDSLDLVAYLDSIAEFPDPLFIGIDPGVTGGIGLLCHNRVFVMDVPSYKKKTPGGSKSDYDYTTIASLFGTILRQVSAELIQVCLEEGQSMTRDTPKTARAIGLAFGIWPLYFASVGISVTLVAPSAWKRHMGLLKQDKEYSRNKALSMWPKASLIRKSDHNRAEALLLALFRSMQLNGEIESSRSAKAKRKRPVR